MEAFLQGDVADAVALIDQMLGYFTAEGGFSDAGPCRNGDQFASPKTTSDTVKGKERPISIPTMKAASCEIKEVASVDDGLGAVPLLVPEGLTDGIGVSGGEGFVGVLVGRGVGNEELVMREEGRAVLRCHLSGIVVVEQQHDLLEAEKPLELMLEGLLGSLSSVGKAHDRPRWAGLVDGKAIELALGDDDALALPPELLAEEGVILILALPLEVLVGVPAFEGDQLAGLGVVGEPDGPGGGVVADVELLAGLLGDGPGLEGDDVPSEVHVDAGVGGAACDLLTCRACVVAAGEAMLVAICVEAVGIATPAAGARLVADELGVVYWNHSGGIE